jgi:hypothetical protein
MDALTSTRTTAPSNSLPRCARTLDAHLDWSAAGIDDPSRIEIWLQHHDKETLAAKIGRTLERRGNAASTSIRSWKYFEKDIFQTGEQELGHPGQANGLARRDTFAIAPRTGRLRRAHPC